MKRQAHLSEYMDEPDVNPDALARSLGMIRQVNRRLGGTSAVIHHLRRWAPHWPTDRPTTILDVATGSADIPEAIVRTFLPMGKPVQVLALDFHPVTIRIAQQWVQQGAPHGRTLKPVRREPLPAGGAEAISFVRADALALPLGDGSVDYAITSMFLHHLNEPDALRVIGEMLRVARRGLIINDLLRNVPAKVFIHLVTLPAGPIDRHDARVSVAKAWTKREVVGWAQVLGAPWLGYHRHFWSRFTLAGERPALEGQA